MEKLKKAIKAANKYLEDREDQRLSDLLSSPEYMTLKDKAERLARQAGLTQNQYARLVLEIKMGR